MSTFPDRVASRLTSSIASTQKLVTAAHQRLNALGSQVSALQPGDWTAIILEQGWTNLAGYIPAQVRYQGAGMAHIVGHITGGSTTNGTVIGTVAEGYYNPVHMHAVTANVMAGASAVTVTGTVSGSSDDSGLTDGTVSGSTTTAGLSNGQTTGTSASASGSGSHSHGAGTYAVTSGQHYHSSSSLAVNNGHHTHTSSALVPSTPVNYNTVTITMNTSGELILTNASSSATSISFNEPLPLITS